MLLRPSPVDDGVRYDAVRREFPGADLRAAARGCTPSAGNWAHVLPLADDVQLLANSTAHADLNVNFGSTMTLDFALHDKPVVTPRSTSSMPPVLRDVALRLLHAVRALPTGRESGAARFARSAEQLAEYVNAY